MQYVGKRKLIGVTIASHANSNDGYAKLLAARKAASDATGKNASCAVRPVPNADTWFIYEFYELK